MDIFKSTQTSDNKKYDVILYQKTFAVEYSLENSITVTEYSAKPIIKLEKLKTNFRTPYSGYLTVEADYSEIYFVDNSFIVLQDNLKRFYLNKGVVIQIYNAINLKAVYFEKD